MDFEGKLAKGISILFHPLLIPFYSFLLIYFGYIHSFFHLKTNVFILFCLLFFVSTFLIPAFIVYFLYRQKVISSLHIREQKERSIPLLCICFYLFALHWTFPKIHIFPEFAFIFLNTLIGLFIITLINLRVKISIHAFGIAALTAFALIVCKNYTITLLPLFLILIFTSGLVCHARLYLREHSVTEVVTGYCLGIILTFVVYSWY